MCLICKGLPGYTVTRSHGPMECGRRRIERETREELTGPDWAPKTHKIKMQADARRRILIRSRPSSFDDDMPPRAQTPPMGERVAIPLTPEHVKSMAENRLKGQPSTSSASFPPHPARLQPRQRCKNGREQRAQPSRAHQH